MAATGSAAQALDISIYLTTIFDDVIIYSIKYLNTFLKPWVHPHQQNLALGHDVCVRTLPQTTGHDPWLSEVRQTSSTNHEMAFEIFQRGDRPPRL